MSEMRTFDSVSADRSTPGRLVFADSETGRDLVFDVKDLLKTTDVVAGDLPNYENPEILARSVYTIDSPATKIYFIRWQNDWCDVPFSCWDFFYEDAILPYCHPATD